MAIDTSSLTTLINDLRNHTTANSISPESVGYVLQRITDLLASVGSAETAQRIQEVLDNLNSVGNLLSTVIPYQDEAGNFELWCTKVNFSTGSKTIVKNGVKPASATIPGVMTSSHVIALDKATTDIVSLKEKLNSIISKLEDLNIEIGDDDNSGGTIVSTAQGLGNISADVRLGELYLRGFSCYNAAGYVPYLFRLTRKRNRYVPHKKRPAKGQEVKYCQPKVGWNLWGEQGTVRLDYDKVVFFKHKLALVNSNDYYAIDNYSSSPDNILKIHIDEKGRHRIPWGRSMVSIHNKSGKERMLRFRFAIGFGPRIKHSSVNITPANMVSNLAEFTIVYDPSTHTFIFSRNGS